MVVVPAFFGVTVPLAETVATAVLEELQLTDEPAGSVVAVSFFATAPLERSVV